MELGVARDLLRNRIATPMTVAAGCAFVAWSPILLEGPFRREEADDFLQFSAVLIASAGTGGLVAGSIFAPLFGLPRWTGWIASAVVGLVVLAVAASIAGVILVHIMAIIDGNPDLLGGSRFGLAGATIGLFYLLYLVTTFFGLAAIAIYIALAHLVARRVRLKR